MLHIQDIDFMSTCPTLVRCLDEIDDWSDANRRLVRQATDTTDTAPHRFDPSQPELIEAHPLVLRADDQTQYC